MQNADILVPKYTYTMKLVELFFASIFYIYLMGELSTDWFH